MSKSAFYDVERVREAIRCPVPSITPQFFCDGRIDYDSSAAVIETCIAGGAKSLLVTFGDSLLSILTDQETVEFNRFTADVSNGRAMVIACSKMWPMGQMLSFAETCRDQGCDLVIPFFPDWAGSLDPQQMAECFRQVGAIMPVMLLTSLGLGNRGIPVSVFDALKPEDGVVAIKDDVAPPYGRMLIGHTREKFAFLQGGRAFNFLEIASFGAEGYLSVYARVFPQVSNRFWQAYCAGDMKQAVQLVETYDVPFFELCAAKGMHFSAAIQGMYEIAGIGARWRRPPYSSLTDTQMDALREFLLARGLTAPEAAH